MCKVTGQCFSTSFTKGNDLQDSLFASMDDKALPKGGQLLTLLHSEGPKLYGVLAILCAIGLRERICYNRSKSKFFSLRVDSQLRRETKMEIAELLPLKVLACTLRESIDFSPVRTTPFIEVML